MSTRSLQLLFLAASLGGLPMARPAAATSGLPSKSFDRVQQRIDALLKQRLKPELLPVLLPNPFRVINGSMNEMRLDEADADGAAESLAGSKPPVEAPPGSNAEALARCVARLRISGTIALNGQLQVVINESPRKEGDFVVLDRDNAMTYLQVVRIRPGEITLGLKDATQTIRF